MPAKGTQLFVKNYELCLIRKVLTVVSIYPYVPTRNIYICNT